MPVHRVMNSILGNKGKLDGAPAAPPRPKRRSCTLRLCETQAEQPASRVARELI